MGSRWQASQRLDKVPRTQSMKLHFAITSRFLLNWGMSSMNFGMMLPSKLAFLDKNWQYIYSYFMNFCLFMSSMLIFPQ